MSQIDLKAFCSTDPSRPYLQAPSSKGDYTYATNGHIGVRVARRPDVPEVKNYPDVGKVISSHDDIAFKALGKIKLPKPQTKKCQRCGGRGHLHNCPDCECECEECHGNGQIRKRVSVAVRGAIVDAYYLAMILTLPEIQVPAKLDKEKPIPFKFDGGVGVLMPMYHAADIIAPKDF